MLASSLRRTAVSAFGRPAWAAASRGFSSEAFPEESTASPTLGPGDSVEGLYLQRARAWDQGLEDGFKAESGAEMFKGSKVVVVGVPGAFTGVCTTAHIPGYVERLDDLRLLGVDKVKVVSVNDPYTMCAWSNKMGLTELRTGDWRTHLCFFGDSDGSFTKALGTDIDLSAAGLGGVRSNRFSMFVVDGVIVQKNVEASAGDLEVSSADTMVQQLEKLREKNPGMCYRGDN